MPKNLNIPRSKSPLICDRRTSPPPQDGHFDDFFFTALAVFILLTCEFILTSICSRANSVDFDGAGSILPVPILALHPFPDSSYPVWSLLFQQTPSDPN